MIKPSPLLRAAIFERVMFPTVLMGYVLMGYVLLLGLVGCSRLVTGQNTLLDRLAGRGPVALSTDNPYIAANLLLAREMERSRELRGFISTQGAPAALEVHDSVFSTPSIELYYPVQHERFVLEPLGDSWLIPSPLPLDGSKFHSVTVLTKDLRGRPALKVATTPESSAPRSDEQESSSSSARTSHGGDSPPVARTPAKGAFQSPPRPAPKLTAAPSPTPSLSPRRVARRTPATKPTPVPTPARPTPSPSLSEPVAGDRHSPLEPAPREGATPSEDPPRLGDLRTGRAPEPKLPRLSQAGEVARVRELAGEITSDAETTPQGDVVHYVSTAKESLSTIAQWYTFDSENGARIGRINHRDDGGSGLEVGDQVVIPSYMVKNKRRLTEKAARELR